MTSAAPEEPAAPSDGASTTTPDGGGPAGPTITVVVVGAAGSTEQELPAGATAWDALEAEHKAGRGDEALVVARVGGELRDLDTRLADGDVVEPVLAASPDGLSVLRHSAAHVLAQAVQQAHPDAKLGIGPPVTDGFYYDFDVETPFTPEDLQALQKAMAKIVKEGQRFRRRVVTEDEARAELADEPYKLELVGLKGPAGQGEVAEGAAAEVGEGELTIYDNLRRDGSVAWRDLCRGPHVSSTRLVGNAFALTRVAAAYWRGDQDNAQLQRVYGTAWATKEGLTAYTERLAEAERRDHRRLGTELDLFSFPEEIGSGLPVFHPRGGLVRREMEDYSRRRHEAAGYSFVNTPHVTKKDLFETSGHLDWYADGMFPPMHLDELRDADGQVRRQGQDYYLKPMNCPFHNLVFRSRGRSYRELPLRLFEFGSVYRYEKSGVVHGLTRVRGMTQDDAHIYCTREQMAGELGSLLEFVLQLLRDYGLDDFYLELSTRNPDKSIGSDEDWEEATEALRQAAGTSGLDLVPDPGGAAFYGPKISVQARDAIGRTWQMSTIQVDFQLPQRFELEYQAADGTRQRPVMIHRALFGSIERFFGVLLEHYAGAFPPWLAPVQVVGIPVAETFSPYLHDVAARLREQGVRVEVDDSDERMQKKIRTHTKQKVPFMLIAGGEDAENGAVSFRFRDGTQDNGVPVEEAVARVVEAVRSRAQV
ncbi:threonyl-tRNA synthetase [Pseudokineococcus lusitanus]|uniref:Threonine--tRNA ligase n=1 Tax=Pseudokineococcus lusitanus TaxID=763993 RepID=A0A3N1G8N0_9ACTN|nr:threonine--tRNA ligase [Pseudokineococcus lusitanus]ROP26601.1 threonyl-tRNA synthetase [Pseudokineococcus lusitanus]